MVEDKYKLYKDIISTILFTVYIIFIIFFVGFALTGGRGLEEPLNMTKAVFYVGFLGIASFLYLFIGKISQLIINISKSEKIKNTIGWISSVIYDPEEAPLGNIPGFKLLYDPIKVILISLLLFSLWGFLATQTQTFLADIPTIQQQILPLAGHFLEVEPASTFETLGLYAFLSIIWGNFKFLRYKYNWNKGFYFLITGLSIWISGAMYWLVYHLFRYGQSDRALGSVILFGSLESIMFFMTGIIIIGIIFHQMNNLFLDLSKSFAQATFLTYVFSIWFLLLSLTIIYFILTRKRKVVVTKPDLK